jgi:hypothetical protein
MMIEPLSNGATYLVLTFYASASTFQTHFRRTRCVRRNQPILKENQAALKIQCLWRYYDATIELHCRIIDQEAAVAIQKLWRGFQQRALFLLARLILSFFFKHVLAAI